MWTCPKCASKVDPSFDVCWNCGTSPEGVEDPSFVSADDTGPILTDPLVPELDVSKDVAVESDLADPADDLVEAYEAANTVEAKFLVDQLKENGIDAVADTHDLHAVLGPREGYPRVWVREPDLPRARAWFEEYDHKKAEPVDE
jgi:hypothetical protein